MKTTESKTLPHEAMLPCSYLLEPATPGCISNVSKAMGLTRLTYVLEQNRSEQFRWGWMLGNKDETPNDRDMMIKGRCKCHLGGREQHKILPNRQPLFTYVLYLCDKTRVLVAQSFFFFFTRGSHLFGCHVHRQRMKQPLILLFQYWE